MKKQSGEAWQIARSFPHLLSPVLLVGCSSSSFHTLEVLWAFGEQSRGRSTSQGTASDSITWDEAAVPKSSVCFSLGPLPQERGKFTGNGHNVTVGLGESGSCLVWWSQITNQVLDSSCVQTKVWEFTAAINNLCSLILLWSLFRGEKIP